MTNFQTAREALETSMNSSGSAMQEHEKWSQSLEAQLLKLKASWQGLSQAFLNSDFLKSALNGLINLTDGVTKLIDTFGTIPTLMGTLAAGLSAFKNKGLFTFDKDAQSIELLGKNLTSLKGEYARIHTAIDRYNSLSSKSASFQNKYNEAMAKSSTSMGKYLSGLNGAKASFGGYISSLIGATASTIALEVATIALNAALTMGISFAISALIKVLDKAIVTKSELAEKVEELTSKYKQQHNELKKIQGDYDTSDESSMISKYEKLSKGVDGLGKNVSLTADEYSEYQSIVNQIAEQIPSLVSGYDSQGNAILSCKGNVEELTVAYEKLIHAQNREVLKGENSKDIEDNFKNIVKEAKSNNGGFLGLGTKLSSDAAKIYKDILNNEKNASKAIDNALHDKDTWESGIRLQGQDIKALADLLEEEGFDRKGSWWNPESDEELVKRAFKDDRKAIKDVLGDFYTDLETETEEMKTKAQAVLSEAFDVSSVISGLDYGNISEKMQDIAYQTVNSLDFDFLSSLQEKGKTVEQWTEEMLDQLNSLSKEDNAKIETAFELQTKFNGGEISYGEYVDGLKNVESTIDKLKLKDTAKNQLKLSLGLDDNELFDQYDKLRNRLVELSTKDLKGQGHFSGASDAMRNAIKEAEKFLNGLSATEYAVAVDWIVKGKMDLSDLNLDSFRKALEKEAKLQDALNYTIAIDVETESLNAVNTAMAESVSGAGLSSEAINALKGRYAELEAEGYNLSAMFEETSNGIHLNREAVSELEQAYAQQKLSETDGQLKVLKNRYEELTTKIKNCGDASDRAALYTEQQSIVEKINDLGTLAAQYEGLTSAYNQWQSAESAGQERDMYEGIISGFENVKDEISRGWIDDGTTEFLELLTGKTDLAGKSGKELKKIYDSLDDTIKNTTYSVRDFFTVDEDGNSTNTGVYNFLDAIGQLEEEKFSGKDVVKRDKSGNIIGFDFELVAKKDEKGNVIKNGDQVIAEALGISEELVQIMVRASDDAGFVVNLEGAYTQLADLKTEAESARDTLISLQEKGLKQLKGVDVNFNLEAEGNDLIKEQKEAVKLLDKFKKDGKIDLKMEGAQQALDIAEYLTIKLDDLTEPKIMQIDISEVDEDLRDPIEKMQEIVELSKEKNLVSLTGDKKEIKETQSEINKVAKELEELDPEIKAKVGIDEDWDAKTIASKVEKGEIEIPAELELDVQMSDDLKDMRLMMMNQLGLASDNEVKLKIGFDVDESLVDTLDDKQQKVVVEYITKNKEEFNKLTEEEKEVVVNLVANGVDLEKYEVEDKEAIVNYIANGEEADGWTPEAKDAFVKYLVDGGEPDKFDPKDKESWVVYKKDSSEPDNYDPEDPEATVIYDKDSKIPDGYDPDKDGLVTFKKDSSAIDSWKPTVTGIAKFTLSMIIPQAVRNALAAVGISIANGTANVDGTAFADGSATELKLSGRAFARGDWRTKKTETALTGELGREIVVTPDNRWYTVGDSGAEFATIPRGSIVFNHRQTEELFKNGKVTSGGGRGRALVGGTAFGGGSTGSGGGLRVMSTTTTKTKETTKTTTTSTGSSGSGGVGKVSGKSASSSTKSTKSSSSSKKSEEEFKETIDWIEVAISRIEREINNLNQKASNVYKSWSSRNTALTKEIGKVGSEINLQQQAYNRYMKEASSVGLSSSWAKKVRDGAIDISTIKDEALKEKIDNYKNWYEKALACKDAIEELKETEASLYRQRFDNVQTQYDAILQGYEHTETMLNEYINQAETQGHIVSKKYYQALINNEKSNIAKLKQEQSALIKARDEAVDSGKIAKYSEDWYNMCAEIDSVTQAIEESNTALLEFDNSMREIDWSVFDLVQERISDVSEEAEFLIELMSNDKLFDDKGVLTGQGAATLGLHAQKYNDYMYQADDYGAEVSKLDKQIAKDPYDQELINRRQELLELQREMILNAEQEKEAIRDLVKEGISLELDALQELIDKKNEQLESEKDLYEYQKKVKEQTDEIASLEKQLSSYSGDDSEEARAKVQELKLSLEEAKTNLEKTEWDKYISDTSAILDNLYLEYETILNTRLDNIDYLLQQVVDGINASMGADGTITSALGVEGAIASSIINAVGENGSIKTILNKEVTAVGTTLSNAMNNIWTVGDGNIKSVLTTYGQGFQDKLTSTNAVLGNIKVSVDNMINALNKEAQKKVSANKTSTSAKKEPTKDSTSSKKTTSTTTKKTTNKSSGDGKPKVGDKVKFISGQYYYDSQGKKPLGSKNQGKEVYITNINTKSWATHPYHISTGKTLGKGDLGWLKLSQISGYATGKKNLIDNELAWTQENGKEFIVRPSDGAILTPLAKSDSVLNAKASSNIWDMANNPSDFIKSNLDLGATNVPNNSSVNNNVTQNFENVVFSMPNVHSYNELLTQMAKDKDFEKLILSMSVDRLAGKSSLAKNKSIR